MNFTDSPNHSVHALSVHLDRRFAQSETPAGLHGVDLYPHQKAALAALLDIERKRVININIENCFKSGVTMSGSITSSAAVLSEPFGSGKTIVIISLILSSQIPRAVPEHRNEFDYRSVHVVYKMEVVRKFVGKSALLRPNLIIVGPAVLIQWVDTIHRHSDLKVLVIENSHGMQEFQKLYETQRARLNAYNIVILKSGMMTGYKDNKACTTGSIARIADITRTSCWSRVIWDDFDTITVPGDSVIVNALFTIYVSATNKLSSGREARRDWTDGDGTSAETAIRNQLMPRISEVHHDAILFNVFNVRSDPSILQRVLVPTLHQYKYLYDNPDDTYIKLLGVMKNEDATSLVEMLNGDAVGMAAATIGIATKSVADIFQRVLDRKYTICTDAKRVVELLRSWKTSLLTLRQNAAAYTKKALDELFAQVKKGVVPQLEASNAQLITYIDEQIAENNARYVENSAAIARVIDNVKAGSCQICAAPLGDFNIFIVKCCGIILCDICGIQGNQIKKQGAKDGWRITGRCANCKSAINMSTDLIFVNQSVDITAITGGLPVNLEPVDTATAAKPTVTEPNPKLVALRAILAGRAAPGAMSTDLNIKNLMVTNTIMPQPERRKYVIFASFDETLDHVEEALVGYRHLRLCGSARDITSIVEQFRSEDVVLLVNSQRACAGLNLEFATDLIFMHLMEENVLAQVVGRVQRIGRVNEATVHYLMYKNEEYGLTA